MTARTTHRSVDEYLAAQPLPARAVLERVRATIRKALPGAVEGISYQIPIYKLDGRMVLYFAGFKSHYSIYPATPGVVGALGDELAGLLHSKATLRFPYDSIPTRLIARIAKLRAAEVAGVKKRERPAPRTSPRRTSAKTRARSSGAGR
jgi:uncharacterized protein YdhG (YjbR/CyaY superfamily)